jgi:hypothetical protein
MQPDELDGWVPIRLSWQESSPTIEWCYVGERCFIDPFFNQTIERCMRHPFNLLFRRQTSLETLGEWQRARPGLRPTGFIFHMSRCGSTLVSQMLASFRQNLVVSEAGPIDSVLRSKNRDSKITDDMRVSWLRAMVSALGQKRSGQEEHFFIKFDSWNTLNLDVIEQAFPGVPSIFLYRDPIEVMVSQLKRSGAHMVPGVIEPELFGLDASGLTQMQSEEYCARVLSSVCRAALEHKGDNPLILINYRRLPEVMWTSIVDFFRMNYTAADIERMKYIAQFDAKNPSLNFSDDSAATKLGASEAVKRMADKWVAPLYERLEAAARP